jgi:hypothetical protein
VLQTGGQFNDQGYFSIDTNLADGMNLLELCARTLSGRTGCHTWNVRVDANYPTFQTLIEPRVTYFSSRYTSNHTPLVKFSYANPVNITDLRIGGISVNLNDIIVEQNNQLFSYYSGYLPQGQYEIEVSAVKRDFGTNESYDNRTFFIDSEAPRFRIAQPANMYVSTDN